MTTKARENSLVLYQDQNEGIAEQALLIEPYNDVISLTQEKATINFNYESIDEICKALKSLKKHYKG